MVSLKMRLLITYLSLVLSSVMGEKRIINGAKVDGSVTWIAYLVRSPGDIKIPVGTAVILSPMYVMTSSKNMYSTETNEDLSSITRVSNVPLALSWNQWVFLGHWSNQ